MTGARKPAHPGYIIAPHRIAGWNVIDLATKRPKVGCWFGRKEDAEAMRDALNKVNS